LDYDAAVTRLSKEDCHHFLVYGKMRTTSANETPSLQLHACTYFSRLSEGNMQTVLSKGLEPAAFKKYLNQLLEQKKVDGRSSGTVAPESVASAFGVSPNGLEAISLSEYCRIVMPHLYADLKPIPTDTPTSPGCGG
jgi:hypothetical protein